MLHRIARRYSSSLISASTPTSASHGRPIAVILGVANHRSIAWACVQEFLQQRYDCIFTYQDERHASKMEQLIMTTKGPQQSSSSLNSCEDNNETGRILGCLPCNVEHPSEISLVFQERIPELLHQSSLTTSTPKIQAVVHSIAYAPNLDQPLLHTSLADYLQAQHVSAYSFLELARESAPLLMESSSSSLTALSYLGAVRAVPGYGVMGPAKAALESLVRGLAVELALSSSSSSSLIRVNAVSAGPVRTSASRGVPRFTELQHHVQTTCPIQRNVTAQEVANTIVWLASTAASGVTGQTIYVDGGYSTVIPIQVK